MINMPKAKILLVEDDLNLGYVIKDNLTVNNFVVTHCDDGEKGFEAFDKEAFDICILDIMLPKRDGFSLAKAIREKDKLIPILFLSAKSLKEDKINGFKLGGDDYITKPFSIEELILRIQVFLKRSKNPLLATEEKHFEIGKYNFDYSNLLLECPESEKTLTQKEADILRLFCIRKDKILKREDILNSVWGDDDYFLGRSLDVFISKLRKYLSHDSRVEIVNFHGVGFKLEIKY